MKQAAQNRVDGERLAPEHTLPTVYRYNSLNQVITQQSPDGGYSEFWYDRLGRLVVSRNAQQKKEGKYSYTLYDQLGRITEVGQKEQVTVMTHTIARDNELLQNWLKKTYRNSNNRLCVAEQVTSTVYDVQDIAAQLPMPISLNQKSYTLRNRVSYTRTYDYLFALNNGNPRYNDYDYSTTYCYDIHGNVDTLLQQYRTGLMAAHGDNRFKVMAYKYDLISGKVNQVHYQPGQTDQLYHRYDYDAENRLTDVYTSDNKALIGDRDLEEHEAHYEYYKHGPLARAVLGQQKVQGLDYAYTLQGWLKGVNTDSTLDAVGTARDAYNYSLHYFNGDYKPIGAPIPIVNAAGNTGFKNLYNGNIGAMAVNIKQFNQPLVYNYLYDQLNRLVAMDAYKGWNGVSTFGPDKINDYQERIAYDGNGNILSYIRNGSTASSNPGMDNLQYGYNKDVNGNITNNKLRHVKDDLGLTGNYTEDIDNQDDDNYGYDAIGNLVKDDAEKIAAIEWNVYGKIQGITKTASKKGDVKTITYTYDASGNRVSKVVKKQGIGGSEYSWYVRDASGNVMAVYSYSGTTLGKSTLYLSEQHLYGSSRLGIWNRKIDMDAPADKRSSINLPGSAFSGSFERGDKFFELSNHLGNVLATISDKKIGHSTDGTNIDYYNADVVSANDYYPFGMDMPGRKYSVANTNYRYGFNGKENDNESPVQYDYGFRIYDPRLVRFKSVDPITSKYPMLTPYQFASNSPISGIDMDGLEYLTAIYNVTIKGGQKTVSADYVWFNSLAHSTHGNLGQGVNYEIKIKNFDNRTTTNNYFVPRGANGDYVTQYGNYMGSAPLSNFNAYTGKQLAGTYRYDVPAVSQVDQLAKLHDQGYDRVKAAGAGGLFSDWGTTPYDEAAAKGWGDYLDKYKVGSKDPYNELNVIIQDRQAARRGFILFNSVVVNKKESISYFMMENYSGEAKSQYSLFGSVQRKADQFNYQLFLQKYMVKDADGNWQRNEKMWKGNIPQKPN